MTIRLRMHRLTLEKDGDWMPAFNCEGCRSIVAADGLAMWDAGTAERLFDGPIAVAGFVVVCGQDCAERIRTKVADVTDWGTLGMAEFIAALAAVTRTSAAVADHLENAALATFILANSSTAKRPTKSGRANANEDV